MYWMWMSRVIDVHKWLYKKFRIIYNLSSVTVVPAYHEEWSLQVFFSFFNLIQARIMKCVKYKKKNTRNQTTPSPLHPGSPSIFHFCCCHLMLHSCEQTWNKTLIDWLMFCFRWANSIQADIPPSRELPCGPVLFAGSQLHYGGGRGSSATTQSSGTGYA